MDDPVLRRYDALRGEFESSGLAGLASGIGPTLVIDRAISVGEHLGLGVPEVKQGADLNGDGDLTDIVLRLFPLDAR